MKQVFTIYEGLLLLKMMENLLLCSVEASLGHYALIPQTLIRVFKITHEQ